MSGFAETTAVDGRALAKEDNENRGRNQAHAVQREDARDEDPDAPLQLQICSLDYSSYVGKIGIGRIRRGRLKPMQEVLVLEGEKSIKAKINQVLKFEGLERKTVDEAEAGARKRIASWSDGTYRCVTFSDAAGRELKVSESVFRSEDRAGHRNRALAWLLRSFNIIESDPEPVVLDYFRQCSVLVTAKDLAVMAATLANQGVNPVTGERVFAPRTVRWVLSVLSTCGMYDDAGTWAIEVGLPSKSGVGGGVAIEVDQGHEALGLTADDGQGQGQAVAGRPHHRFGTAADAHPRPQRGRLGGRVHPLGLQGWPGPARPRGQVRPPGLRAPAQSTCPSSTRSACVRRAD